MWKTCRWHVQAGDDDEGDDDDNQMAIQSPTAAADDADGDDDDDDERHSDNRKHLDNDVVTQSPDSYSSHNDDGKPHIMRIVLLVNVKEQLVHKVIWQKGRIADLSPVVAANGLFRY